jgi:uncharacterized protein
MFMSDLLERGLLYFNEGKFYEAHEVWEDLWRETDGGALKTCYQGLIQAAVGLHHLGRGNAVGARSQLGKSIRNLNAGAGAMTRLDIESLIQQLATLLDNMPDAVPQALRIAKREIPGRPPN